eukprot:scaffold160447_cov22-Prasinocladus_malaysianus.AAC.1
MNIVVALSNLYLCNIPFHLLYGRSYLPAFNARQEQQSHLSTSKEKIAELEHLLPDKRGTATAICLTTTLSTHHSEQPLCKRFAETDATRIEQWESYT